MGAALKAQAHNQALRGVDVCKRPPLTSVAVLLSDILSSGADGDPYDSVWLKHE